MMRYRNGYNEVPVAPNVTVKVWVSGDSPMRVTKTRGRKADVERAVTEWWAQASPWGPEELAFRWIGNDVADIDPVRGRRPVARESSTGAHPAAYLPVNIGEKIRFEAHGQSFLVGYHSRNTYWLATDPPGERRRWGTRDQITEDIEYVLSNGVLPPASGPMWEGRHYHVPPEPPRHFVAPRSRAEWLPYEIKVRVNGRTITFTRFASNAEHARRSAADMVEREYMGRGEVVSVRLTTDPRRRGG